jgi:hypothetical protein
MPGHQLIKPLRLTRLAVMSAPVRLVPISDWITRVIGVTRQSNYLHPKYSYGVLFLPTLVILLDIYSDPLDSIPLLYSVYFSGLARM